MCSKPLSPTDVLHMSLTCTHWKPGETTLSRILCKKRLTKEKSLTDTCMNVLDRVIDTASDDDQTKILEYAIESGSIDIIGKCYTRGYYMNSTNDEGQSILCSSIATGNVEVTEFLLTKCGVYVNLVDQFGETPLMFAVMKGYLNMVKLLCDNGAYINNQAYDMATPLYLAVGQDRIKIAEYLLSKGSMVDMPDGDGVNPFHLAVRKQSMDMVRLLSTYGADMEALVEYTGYTAMHTAVSLGNIDIAEFIICKGCDENAKTIDGKSNLHVACLNGQLDMVDWILSRNKQHLNELDEHSRTPLYYAVMGGNLKMIQTLLKNGADSFLDDSWLRLVIDLYVLGEKE